MKVNGLGVVSLFLQGIHLHTKSRILDRDFVLLRHVQLMLLLEQRASIPLTQDLKLGPVCGELLRETQLRRDGARHSGLLVLGAGRRRGSKLSQLVCLVEVVKCGRTRVQEQVSWERAVCGGGGESELVAALQPATDICAGRSDAGYSVQS